MRVQFIDGNLVREDEVKSFGQNCKAVFDEFSDAVTGGGGGSSNSGGTNHDSLIAALAGDATKIGQTFIAADAAKSAAKTAGNSKNGVYLIAGGVAIVLIIAVVILKK